MTILGADQREVSKVINKCAGFVSECVSLLKLPPEIKALVKEGKLPLRKALEIGKLSNAGSRQRLTDRVERFGLDSLREIIQKKLDKEKARRKRREKGNLSKDFRSVLKSLPKVRIYKDRVSLPSTTLMTSWKSSSTSLLS
jgi:hypothetical protein